MHRSTPTPVGKTSPVVARFGAKTVHPHARGENITPIIISPLTFGPPPRPWGKRSAASRYDECCRSTPTPVGKTFTTAMHSFCPPWSTPTPVGKTVLQTMLRNYSTVHPHARGENARVDHVRREQIRSTPTPVGKTLLAGSMVLVDAVHPHARGENLQGYLYSMRAPRSTPTPVGKTSNSIPSFRAMAVHPHARGENALEWLVFIIHHGPPPRPWGKQLLVVLLDTCPRSTPTPVGKTHIGYRCH